MSGWERHLERAVNGTVQLGPRGWRWLWESKAGRTIIARLAATAFAGWAMYRLAGQWPWLWGVAVALVIVQGYRGAEEQQDGEVEDADAPAPLAPALTRAAMRTELIATIRRLAEHRAGVHLAAVHADWLDRGLLDEGRSLSEFREFVESLGLVVVDSVKTRGATRIGVHVADLPGAAPAPAAATPPPAVSDDLFQDWSSPQVSPGTTPVDYRPDYPKDYPC